jgi:hypothetical protein
LEYKVSIMDRELVKSAMIKCSGMWSSIGKAALRGIAPGAAIGAGAGAIQGGMSENGSILGGALKGGLYGGALGGLGAGALRGSTIGLARAAKPLAGMGYTNLSGVARSGSKVLGGFEKAIGMGGNAMPGWTKGIQNWATGTAAPAVQQGAMRVADQAGKVATASLANRLARDILEG